MVHSALYLDYRHDLFRVCVFIAVNALLANFLPRAARFRKHRTFQCFYIVVIDLVAAFGLNWRAELPSLNQEFMGFKRRVGYGYRNWRGRRRETRQE